MSNDNLPIQHYTVADIEVMAGAVAQSRLFGMDAPQAMTLMLLAQSEGIHPMQAVKRYHVIQGRPALKADAMLADFQSNGGTVKWTERSDKAWEGIFRHPIHAPEGETFRFTIEDARRADLLRNPTWTKYPSNMLRARVVSNAIRAILPSVVAGIYTPEEVVDFVPAPAPVVAPVLEVAKPNHKKTSDRRTLAKLIQDGVDSTNYEFSKGREPGEVILNVFEVQNHLLKFLVGAGAVPDPGRISQGQRYAILEAHYATPEGRRAIRRELGIYLGDRLAIARSEAAAAAEIDGGHADEDVVTGGEVEAEELAQASREPGEEG